MAIQLDHMILAVNDRKKSIEFYVGILGLKYEGDREPFSTLRVTPDFTLQIAQWGTKGGEHLAFAMSRAEFDEVFRRVREAKIEYGDAFDKVGGALFRLGPDFVSGLAGRTQEPGCFGAERVEHLRLVEGPRSSKLFFERIDGDEQLSLAVTGDDKVVGDPLEEGAHLCFGVATERGRERSLHDVVGRKVWSARNETPPLGLSHLYPGICGDFSAPLDIVLTPGARPAQPARIPDRASRGRTGPTSARFDTVSR